MDIECIVTGERGIFYGKIIPNPDPTKPPINMQRLYERGETVMIDEKDFVDFDKVNAERNKARGQEIEVSYRKTGNAPKSVSISGMDLEAIKAQIKMELKAEMERDALRGHNPVSAVKGK